VPNQSAREARGGEGAAASRANHVTPSARGPAAHRTALTKSPDPAGGGLRPKLVVASGNLNMYRIRSGQGHRLPKWANCY
jgi:hypothetical protein